MKSLLLVCLMAPTLLFSQGLSSERIDKIKNSTVRIEIEGKSEMGTGFFVTNNGRILTCWHVIDPAMMRDSSYKIVDFRKIFITTRDGAKYEVGIVTDYLSIKNAGAVGYDYCLLQLVKPFRTPFLKLGNFNSVKEGDEIYTCGFPVGIKQQFVSKGMVSTIFIDTTNSIANNGKIIPMPRTQAMLDITLNHGNSGGAIVRAGLTADDDEVIGLADYIITPMQQQSYLSIKEGLANGSGFVIGGINQNALFSYFNDLISKMSIGVSGCVSINHFLTSLNSKKN